MHILKMLLDNLFAIVLIMALCMVFSYGIVRAIELINDIFKEK